MIFWRNAGKSEGQFQNTIVHMVFPTGITKMSTMLSNEEIIVKAVKDSTVSLSVLVACSNSDR